MNKNSSEKHLNQSKKVFFIWPDSLVKAVLFLYELIMIGEKAIQAKKKRFKPSWPYEECLAIQHDQTSLGHQKFCYLGTLNHCNTFCLFGRRSNMFDMNTIRYCCARKNIENHWKNLSKISNIIFMLLSHNVASHRGHSTLETEKWIVYIVHWKSVLAFWKGKCYL